MQLIRRGWYYLDGLLFAWRTKRDTTQSSPKFVPRSDNLEVGYPVLVKNSCSDDTGNASAQDENRSTIPGFAEVPFSLVPGRGIQRTKETK